MAEHSGWREPMFQLRYAMEQFIEAAKEFTDTCRQAAADELARRQAARQGWLAQRQRDAALFEADYQEWKRQLEERGL